MLDPSVLSRMLGQVHRQVRDERLEGANVDIYVGASAPLFAWLSTRGRLGMKFALAWNVLGLLALTNVVIRAVLTAPGPFNLIHAEVPNLMMGAFPFMFIHFSCRWGWCCTCLQYGRSGAGYAPRLD